MDTVLFLLLFFGTGGSGGGGLGTLPPVLFVRDGEQDLSAAPAIVRVSDDEG